jgi:PKD repeat protein
MITPYYAIPLVTFTSNVTSGSAPLSVGFSDASANIPTSWYWYFGDGGTSSEQNPVYEYTDAGTYSVSLTATNSAGSNTTTQSSLITVTAITTPVVSFTSDVTTGTAPLIVQFTDTSSYSPTSWQWTFGDGISSTYQNPTHTYTTAGTYTVLLSASNAGGSRSKTVNDYIVVSAPVTSTTVPTIRPVTVTATSSPAVTGTAVLPEAPAVNQTTSGSGESSGLLPIFVMVFAILACVGIFAFKRNPPRRPRRSRGREL